MRRLVSQLVSTRCRRQAARRESWSYFGSFGDDCFDDPPARRSRVFCRRRWS